MKSARYCGLLLWLAAAAAAAPAQDASDPVPAALAQARARHEPMLVNYHAPWCYSCYYMAHNVLNGLDWERVQREMVVVDLDADSPEGARWMRAWTVKAMPSYLLFDADGRELGRLLGEQTRADFYRWLWGAAGRSPLDDLKAKVVDGGEASLAAAREILRAYHERYDGKGGLAWYLGLPPPVRTALARDAQAALWVERLELQRAAAENDVAACLGAGDVVLAGSLGCERPYELSKVMACSAGQPAEARRTLLQPQAEMMQVLVDKRVLSSYRCADERSIVLGAADLYQALGDATREKSVLDRAIADVARRIGGAPGKDRNLDDNLRVYLDRAGRADELDAWLVKLIAAYPDDYVYPFRHGRNLAARGRHAEALPYFEQAAAKAYGVNKLQVAEQRARSLQALNRSDDARAVLSEALRDNGPWFADDAAKLKALLDTLPATKPAGAT